MWAGESGGEEERYPLPVLSCKLSMSVKENPTKELTPSHDVILLKPANHHLKCYWLYGLYNINQSLSYAQFPQSEYIYIYNIYIYIYNYKYIYILYIIYIYCNMLDSLYEELYFKNLSSDFKTLEWVQVQIYVCLDSHQCLLLQAIAITLLSQGKLGFLVPPPDMKPN